MHCEGNYSSHSVGLAATYLIYTSQVRCHRVIYGISLKIKPSEICLLSRIHVNGALSTYQAVC